MKQFKGSLTFEHGEAKRSKDAVN